MLPEGLSGGSLNPSPTATPRQPRHGPHGPWRDGGERSHPHGEMLRVRGVIPRRWHRSHPLALTGTSDFCLFSFGAVASLNISAQALTTNHNILLSAFTCASFASTLVSTLFNKVSFPKVRFFLTTAKRKAGFLKF